MAAIDDLTRVRLIEELARAREGIRLAKEVIARELEAGPGGPECLSPRKALAAAGGHLARALDGRR